MKPRAQAVVLLGLLVLSSCTTGAYLRGEKAYKAGHYHGALTRWLPLANAGNDKAQYMLGVMYENGTGVPKDEAEAVRWYRRAADQGNALAQRNLGWMYERGRGVPKDEAEAVRWYRMAADQGLATAQTDLG